MSHSTRGDAPPPAPAPRRRSFLARFGPGILVAATGVGAGDLATAAFTGGRLGTAVLWAVVLGALLKFVVTEGIARWQVATGETLLEGAMSRLGRPAQIVFGLYFFPWCLFVGGALMSACGVAAQSLVPMFDDAEQGKLVLGIGHSAVGAALVLAGGFKLFERAMAVCVGLMFLSVTATAVMLRPDLGDIARGLFVPVIPDAGGEGVGWTVALIGGVGGTLTVLCYGYWLREQQSDGGGETTIGAARADLGLGYAVTAVFGLAMVVIGSTVSTDGSGVGLIANLGDRVGEVTGGAGRFVFLFGAWTAIVSSLLGVWQSVPMLFVTWLDAVRGARVDDDPPRRAAYKVALVALALVPIVGLQLDFRSVQKLYGVFGATFVPVLAVALLVMNGRRGWVGAHRNGPWTIAALGLCLAFFAWLVVRRFMG